MMHRRVDEVFDCWFESGSMPYAQQHYPFENKEVFDKSFPADFIAEGIDQTRGWFYTLMVLSTALFDKPAFKNLICNGLVLAEDGQKMSKRKQNYPKPELIIDTYGADALRLYLINSPVVRAADLCFKEAGVKQNLKDIFLPWYHAYRLFVQSARTMLLQTEVAFAPQPAVALASSNTMDRWILAAANGLVAFMRTEMEAYRLYTVVPRLVDLVEQLTNWYIRMNKERFSGERGEACRKASLCTLYEVLMMLCRMMAPLTPFFCELVYRNLARASDELPESVHFMMIPEVRTLRKAREELCASDGELAFHTSVTDHAHAPSELRACFVLPRPLSYPISLLLNSASPHARTYANDLRTHALWPSHLVTVRRRLASRALSLMCIRACMRTRAPARACALIPSPRPHPPRSADR
eukprot:5318160-Pleurochrysis_carterae.AAC.1